MARPSVLDALPWGCCHAPPFPFYIPLPKITPLTGGPKPYQKPGARGPLRLVGGVTYRGQRPPAIAPRHVRNPPFSLPFVAWALHKSASLRGVSAYPENCAHDPPIHLTAGGFLPAWHKGVDDEDPSVAPSEYPARRWLLARALLCSPAWDSALDPRRRASSSSRLVLLRLDSGGRTGAVHRHDPAGFRGRGIHGGAIKKGRNASNA